MPLGYGMFYCQWWLTRLFNTARSHNFIPPHFSTIDHIVVVLRDDVDARRLPRVPPPEFRVMYVPDPRVSFVMIFSEAEFQLWKLTAEFPTLYPYESSGSDFSGEREDVKKAENEKKKQDVPKASSVKDTSATLAESDIPVIIPLQTATQRAFEIFRRIALQQALRQTGFEDGSGGGNENGLGQDHAGDKITTAGDTITNNTVVDESASAADPPPSPKTDLNPGGKACIQATCLSEEQGCATVHFQAAYERDSSGSPSGKRNALGIAGGIFLFGDGFDLFVSTAMFARHLCPS
ncbi:hypothetical protein N7481_006755 [Penicillium waksmanii]|uniref:uncharacterized protein n=1 Tax=Penicillium waksmanii TaxID=69791 RepID=UPI00254973AB|nr:uncharacterized protein N7481_006755 [Penicillium waksmanii]KAJ5984656.1 hypothetical protein N7481_006755 [Penicillium waksmanii]